MTQDQVVTKTEVTDGDKRLALGPRVLGILFTEFERQVYTNMRTLTKGAYNSGYWKMYDLSNGGMLMTLDQEGEVDVTVAGNWYDGRMSVEAASIVANLFAYGAAGRALPCERAVDAYHALYAFAVTHPEWAQIRRAID